MHVRTDSVRNRARLFESVPADQENKLESPSQQSVRLTDLIASAFPSSQPATTPPLSPQPPTPTPAPAPAPAPAQPPPSPPSPALGASPPVVPGVSLPPAPLALHSPKEEEEEGEEGEGEGEGRTDRGKEGDDQGNRSQVVVSRRVGSRTGSLPPALPPRSPNTHSKNLSTSSLPPLSSPSSPLRSPSLPPSSPARAVGGSLPPALPPRSSVNLSSSSASLPGLAPSSPPSPSPSPAPPSPPLSPPLSLPSAASAASPKSRSPRGVRRLFGSLRRGSNEQAVAERAQEGDVKGALSNRSGEESGEDEGDVVPPLQSASPKATLPILDEQPRKHSHLPLGNVPSLPERKSKLQDEVATLYAAVQLQCAREQRQREEQQRQREQEDKLRKAQAHGHGDSVKAGQGGVNEASEGERRPQEEEEGRGEEQAEGEQGWQDRGVEWRDEEEGEHNIRRNEGRIVGATPAMLVQQLSGAGKIDMDFTDTFLGTYRSFLEPLQLFALLLRRFHGTKDERDDQRDIVRFHVHFVLRRWLERHPNDLQDALYVFVERFVQVLAACHLDNLAVQLEKALVRTASRVGDHVVDNAPPPRFPPPCSSWLDVDDLELARQLTLMEASAYNRLERTEFFSCAWSKPKHKHKAPNVLVEIERFNTVSMFLATEITKCRDASRRKAVMEKVISVMDHLLSLNNFNTTMAFLAGLSNAAVHRLKATKGQLSRKHTSTHKRISTLLASDHNYSALRQTHAERKPPKLPFLGMYLTDLTFISDGMSDEIPGTTLVNFEKRNKEHQVIQKILADQVFSYNLIPIPRVQELLKDLPHASDKDVYAMSLECEPRRS